MKKVWIILFIISFAGNIVLSYQNKDYQKKIISLQKNFELVSNAIKPLEKKVAQLTALKKHFYDFRERVYKGIPLDYLSHITLEDFNFKKYEAD